MVTLGVFDLAGRGVPDYWAFAEVGFVGHVAGEGRVMAEDGVFGERLAAAYRLEISPHVGTLVIPVVALVGVILAERLLAGGWVVFFVPFLVVSLAEIAREAGSVIAGGRILAGLRIMSDGKFSNFEDAFRALEAVHFRRFATEIETKINGRLCRIQRAWLEYRAYYGRRGSEGFRRRNDARSGASFQPIMKFIPLTR